MSNKKRTIALATAGLLLLGATVYAGAGSPSTKGDALEGRGAGVLAGIASTEKRLPRFESEAELRSMLEESEIYYGGYYIEDMIMEEAEPAPTSSESGSGGAGASMKTAESSASADYSETNNQVQGVDEGDLIKTDGAYIYSLQNNVVRIHKVDRGTIALQSQIAPEDESVQEIYLAGDNLVLVSTKRVDATVMEDQTQTAPKREASTSSYYPHRPQKSFTVYTVYDVTDRQNPQVKRSFELEGYSASTRVVDDTLYFVVNKYLYYGRDGDLPEILPVFREAAASGGITDAAYTTVPVTEVCYFPGELSADSYMMVGAMDIKGDTPVAFESILSSSHDFYMNTESLYITKYNWNWYYDRGDRGNNTSIYRFDIAKDGVVFAAEGSVTGTVLNQYSMDEHDGYFRIATTDSGLGNYITVFDRNLVQLGQTPALAPDETIHSARFIGTMGYMVTYRQTDPLYAVDLSDPSQPKVLDALKIPGFSQYLHPVGDGLLIGFGRHTTETYIREEDGTERVTGTIDMGSKVSLFDISNPKNLREIDVMLLGEDTYSEAFTNPRALMVNPGQKMFGFFLTDYSADRPTAIRLISVEGDKLKDLASLSMSSSGYYNNYGSRLVYVGETLYSLDSAGLTAFNLNTYTQIGSIRF